jgi:hypothetical protein
VVLPPHHQIAGTGHLIQHPGKPVVYFNDLGNLASHVSSFTPTSRRD